MADAADTQVLVYRALFVLYCVVDMSARKGSTRTYNTHKATLHSSTNNDGVDLPCWVSLWFWQLPCDHVIRSVCGALGPSCNAWRCLPQDCCLARCGVPLHGRRVRGAGGRGSVSGDTLIEYAATGRAQGWLRFCVLAMTPFPSFLRSCHCATLWLVPCGLSRYRFRKGGGNYPKSPNVAFWAC